MVTTAGIVTFLVIVNVLVMLYVAIFASTPADKRDSSEFNFMAGAWLVAHISVFIVYFFG